MAPTKVAQPTHFIVDPARDGVANALWYTNSGALALSGASPNQFRFNTDDGIVRADLLYGVFEFSVRFPLAGVQTPTNLVNDIAFGLKNASMGNFGKIDVFIDQSGDSITFRTYDEFGTVQDTVLTWDTDWNTVQTIFRISWSQGQVTLEVLPNAATAWVALASHTARIPNRPLNPFVTVVGAENLDVDFIAVRNAQYSSIMLI